MQRAHHGGTGHHHDRTEDRGQRKVPTQSVFRRRRGSDPGDHRADRDEIADDMTDVLELGEFQGETAFEQDERHRDRHERHQHFAEHLFGIDELKHGTGKKTDDEQQQD